MLETGNEKFGSSSTPTVRTPFATTINSQPKQSADITCQIGGTLRATIKDINLTPGDLCKILCKLPPNCHIISIDTKQYHHAESKEGEMYNDVQIEYQTDELMQDTPDDNITFRGGDDNFGLGPNVILCEYSQRELGDTTGTNKAYAKSVTLSSGDEDPLRLLTSMAIEEAILKAAIVPGKTNRLYRFVGIADVHALKVAPIGRASDVKHFNHIVNVESFMYVNAQEVINTIETGDIDTLSYSPNVRKDPWPDYIISKFEQLKDLAEKKGYHIKPYTDKPDMRLYYHADYPDYILLDKDAMTEEDDE